MISKIKCKNCTPTHTLYILSVILFALYLSLLVWVISLKCNLKVTITDTYYFFGAMTLREKLQFVKESFAVIFKSDIWKTDPFDARQDILNVIVFIPFGIYTSYFAKRCKFLNTVIPSVLLSFGFELLQLISNIGAFSAVDLVTNTVGALIGYLVYRLIYKNSPKRIKALVTVSSVMIIFLGILVYRAVMNTANMFDFYIDILLKRI